MARSKVELRWSKYSCPLPAANRNRTFSSVKNAEGFFRKQYKKTKRLCEAEVYGPRTHTVFQCHNGKFHRYNPEL
jgi:hypothetical protein